MADGLLFHCSLEVLAYPSLVWAELLLFFHHKPSVTRNHRLPARTAQQ
jgi:hypothetical protein